MIPVILCGGTGSRLWPLSREAYPKQFLTLTGSQTMLQATALRLDGLPTVDLEALTVHLETETAIGDAVELTILRDGQEVTISVTLGEEPQA